MSGYWQKFVILLAGFLLALGLLQTSLQALGEDAFIIDDDAAHWDADIGLSNGGVVPASVAQLFRVYFGALGRLPDNGGFLWWTNEIAEGKHDLRSMAAGFIFSDEFQGIADTDDNGAVSNTEFVDHMYRNVFGRESDSAGFEWWTSELSSGRRSQTDVLVDMTQSNEYVQLTLTDVAGYLPLGGEMPTDEPASGGESDQDDAAYFVAFQNLYTVNLKTFEFEEIESFYSSPWAGFRIPQITTHEGVLYVTSSPPGLSRKRPGEDEFTVLGVTGLPGCYELFSRNRELLCLTRGGSFREVELWSLDTDTGFGVRRVLGDIQSEVVTGTDILGNDTVATIYVDQYFYSKSRDRLYAFESPDIGIGASASRGAWVHEVDLQSGRFISSVQLTEEPLGFAVVPGPASGYNQPGGLIGDYLYFARNGAFGRANVLTGLVEFRLAPFVSTAVQLKEIAQ